jgi:hypothetical protein
VQIQALGFQNLFHSVAVMVLVVAQALARAAAAAAHGASFRSWRSPDKPLPQTPHRAAYGDNGGFIGNALEIAPGWLPYELDLTAAANDRANVKALLLALWAPGSHRRLSWSSI